MFMKVVTNGCLHEYAIAAIVYIRINIMNYKLCDFLDVKTT